uniref:EF-hand domain-containing protein n=1 Tax=Patiria miniata TaxID=46514 RepID=A0A914BHM6_PATMI
MDRDKKKTPPDSDGERKLREFIDAAVQTTEQGTVGRKPKKRCGCLLVFLLSVVIAVLAVATALVVKSYEMRRIGEMMVRSKIGEEGYAMFQSYDRDSDGYLSLAEFEPLLNKLAAPDNVPVDFDSFMQDIDPLQEVLSVETHFQALIPESMTTERGGVFSNKDANLAGLDDWMSPFRSVAGFGVPQFTAFLPEGAVPVGQVYELVRSNLNVFSNTLSSNRYYPPQTVGREVLLHALLSMFHPRPFVHTRFGPQGAAALIRAENEMYVDVVFRIHAEFQLNEPPINPFWFTPAQFTGNLIIKRDSSHIEHFHLYVPSNKSLNVDMEWMNGPMENENMEVDIGYMPQMELTVSSPSSHISVYGENGEVLQEAAPPINDLLNGNVVWNNQITMEDAFSILELHYYSFKKVPYLSFSEAFQRAAAEEKLVHSILLWGSLDDQSCCGSGRTLRETALESTPVITLLEEHFISSWSLVADLEKMKEERTQDHREFTPVAKLASTCLDAYSFPVQMSIMLPNGTVVHSVNANDLLDMGQEQPTISQVFTDPLVSTYVKFLETGLDKAKAFQ